MVQGELNTALSPSIANQTQANNVGARLYENINSNNMNGVSGVNDPNSASNGGAEKKKKVGNYIISKTIGEGSFAKVRLGYHLITQQMVAVKVINKREVLKRNYLRANLRREASMMQRMQHPHIIQLYEVMETENCYYIVMELIDGIEFVKYLTKKRSLDENETRQYIRQICSAVDHMHKAKVVHRDIKLQNFMLDQNHNLTIIDFGLSNCLDDRDFLNTQCGSPAYAAPEIFAHQDYGSEVDIWSIGVNMYAMLAGKLPFKVENRSKNLAKLHACILKGFEMPTYLSPDCQDLLCRLLDPSPSKRLKMSEIFAHPWLNYNSFPVEIIPYKPVVDLKEIKPQIVQYLVQKHDYTENEVIDAIVHRKPIAIKAVYYLIEKRLKQGLSFPDADYQNSVENENAVYTSNMSSSKHMANSAGPHLHHQQHHGSNGNILLDNANINNLGSSFQPAPVNGGLVKQNSQLLPKRHGIQLVTRSSSQKNVDFKSIFNNMNMHSNGSSASGATRISFNNLNRETTTLNHHNNNDSQSPSPDFIAAAMSPIKTNQQQVSSNNHTSNLHHVNSASSSRNAKSTHYQDIIQRKSNSNVNSNGANYQQNQQHGMTNGGVTNKYMSNERYYVPMSTNGYHPNRMSPASEDSYAPVSSVHYHSPENIRTATTSSNYVSINPGANNRTGVMSNGVGGTGAGLTGIRSLPSSIYRGSPERSLPRSPERMPIDHNNNYRPTTSRVSSSRPSANGSELSGAATYDAMNGQKYKSGNQNYMGTKRSLTSCEDPNYDSSKSKNSVNIIKNRQLQMGKAKIDLDTQQNFNVGVSIKNLGSYLKSSITRNSADALKTFNSLNIKPSSNYGKTSAHVNGSNEQVNVGSSKSRQSTTLTHRHSNPGSSYSTSSNHANGTNMKTRTTLQQNPPNTISTDPSALPRIRINS